MNIIKSGTSQVSYLFSERLLPALSAQQQKLGTIKTVALGALLLFVGCLVCRTCWNSKKKVKLATDGMKPDERRQHIDTLLKRGHEQYDKGELKFADLVFQEIVQLDSKNVEALTMIGTILRDKEEYSESLGQIEKALKIDPKFPDALFQKGRTLGKLKQKGQARQAYGEAVIACEELLKSDANDSKALVILACSLFRMSRFEEAAGVYPRLIQKDKQNVQWVQDYAECLESLKRDGEAAEIYKQGLQAHPDHNDLLVSHARCLTRLGRRDEAIEQYEKLLRAPDLDLEERGIIIGELSRVLTAYAKVLKEAENYEDAAALYDKCAECRKDNPHLKDRYERMAEKLRAKSPRLQNENPADDQTDEQCLAVLDKLATGLKRTDTIELSKALKELKPGDSQEEKAIYRRFSMRVKEGKQQKMQALLDALKNDDSTEVTS